jgi:hypothetical protein
MLHGPESAAYELLVLAANAMGWEALLDLRAALFLVAQQGDAEDDAGPVEDEYVAAGASEDDESSDDRSSVGESESSENGDVSSSDSSPSWSLEAGRSSSESEDSDSDSAEDVARGFFGVVAGMLTAETAATATPAGDAGVLTGSQPESDSDGSHGGVDDADASNASDEPDGGTGVAGDTTLLAQPGCAAEDLSEPDTSDRSGLRVLQAERTGAALSPSLELQSDGDGAAHIPVKMRDIDTAGGDSAGAQPLRADQAPWPPTAGASATWERGLCRLVGPPALPALPGVRTAAARRLGRRYISAGLEALCQALYHDISAATRYLDFPKDADAPSERAPPAESPLGGGPAATKDMKMAASEFDPPAMRAALEGMKMAELRRCALAAGLREADLDAAYDVPNPRAALITLLIEVAELDSENGEQPPWLMPHLPAPATDPMPLGLVKARWRSRLSVDWARLGYLALRLDRPDDAEIAFRHAVDNPLTPSYVAWTALLRLYARAGFSRESLIAAEEILNYLDQPSNSGAGAEAGDAASQEYERVPHTVVVELTRLCATGGLQQLRQVARKLGIGHTSISELFLDAVRWHTEGYDR